MQKKTVLKEKKETVKRLIAGHLVEQRKAEGWKETGGGKGSSVFMERERTVTVVEEIDVPEAPEKEEKKKGKD